MNRFDDFDGDIVPEGLWRGRVNSALRGKRGQRALREIREALLALPAKRLIAGALVDSTTDGYEFCAVGAWAFHKRVKGGQSAEEALEDLARAGEMDGEPYDTCYEAQRQGVAWSMAWELAQQNDSTLHAKTPEERY